MKHAMLSQKADSRLDISISGFLQRSYNNLIKSFSLLFRQSPAQKLQRFIKAGNFISLFPQYYVVRP